MIWKRPLDLALGIPFAVAAAPIILVLCAFVTFVSGWPPLIVQTRVGAGERPIRVVKLRTMRVGVPTVAKSDLLSSPGLPDKPYISGGRFLRAASLDELPQIYNVLIGSMSLVGPRPALPSQEDLLTLRRAHDVTALRPGITGLAQINGREALSLATKVRFEAHYRRHASLGLDLAILFKTARAIVSGRGAY
ncbi:MAG: sugar transferase [Chloroflexota bacterium]|nr:sugar transferase [Chloroflexota bacterium]